MDIILVPGFWLDASSWEEVTPALEAAGHTTHPLTLPGLESVDARRAGITLKDHIAAVVDVVDGLEGKVVLVGHSGGGAVIHGVADARPDRIARNIYVDSGPLGEGDVINNELPAKGDDVPLPPWDGFEDADLVASPMSCAKSAGHAPSPSPRAWPTANSACTTSAGTRSRRL
jgi:pimeloyl-ACP methyl ester carboxylesterase